MLVKQIPAPDDLQMLDGRLVRDGVDLEVNAYCRRANAIAVTLAGPGGEVVVFTMGPPAAEDALREMIACGASRGVHLCDPAFAGADTLATSRALVAALQAEGPFDLVVAGLNSLDADTGQVGPQVAALLDLPFLPGVRSLRVDERRIEAELETDDGSRSVTCTLPAVVSTAERLCEPSKAPPEARREVAAARIALRSAASLGLNPDAVGVAGSPTVVGPSKLVASGRRQRLATDPADAVKALDALGAFAPERATPDPVPATGGTGPGVWCWFDHVATGNQPLVAAAAVLAAELGGSVTVVVRGPAPPGLGAYGADHLFVVPDDAEPDAAAAAVGEAVARAQPTVVLVEGTRLGRMQAATISARHGWGLVGDAIGLDLSSSGRLVAWKPAFGGQLVSAIESRSTVQLATVRPGVLPHRHPRPAADPRPETLPWSQPSRMHTVAVCREDDELEAFLSARYVVGVGTGVDPERYAELEPLQAALHGAPLAATRRVTDRGWLPRSRQVGITGHAIAPHLYVAIGVSGKLNHMVGVRAAATVLAINRDAEAPVFHHADVGLVAEWDEVVPELARLLAAVGQ